MTTIMVKRRQERHKRLNKRRNNDRVSGNILLLVGCAMMPMMFLMHRLFGSAHQLTNTASSLLFDDTAPTRKIVITTNPIVSTRSPKKYPVVDCTQQLATRNQTDSGDPNSGMSESPKRYTKTDPAFWISLHKEYFDKLRWASIMVKGIYYETGITDQFEQILKGKPSGLVIDIGMNIGWFSLLAGAHGHIVAAFEPNPIMHTRVCESLVLNHWDSSDGSSSVVQIFPYGLGRESATLNLTMGNNPGSSSFHEDRLAKKVRRSIAVPVTTLDDVAQQEGWLSVSSNNNNNQQIVPIHLMKVDVEGFEPHVFGGAQQLLTSGRIDNIIMEHSITDLVESTDLMVTIAQAGYQLNVLSTVKGEAYHPEMLPRINKALETASVGMKPEDISEDLNFLAKVTSNLWWTKKKRLA